MKRCPITYDIISTEEDYSKRGLKLLSPALTHLEPLQYTAAEQRAEALELIGKMSIQGVQTKMSAKLNVSKNRFDIVAQGGTYILKPQSEFYPELPENEAISMTLAARVGIDVPVHGMVYSRDKSMTYFIKRFDRVSGKNKVNLEDFSQLSRVERDVKYKSSMEQVVDMLRYCTFPKIEAMELFKRTLFNFLIGNEDMHLKNFSLITRNNKITLAPAYDFVNSTIVLRGSQEELALPLNGKKKNLTRNDFVRYFAEGRLALNEKTIAHVFSQLEEAIPAWKELIRISFLSEQMKLAYIDLLEKRAKRLNL